MKPAILVTFGTLLVIAQGALPLSGGWEWVERGGAIAILGFAVVWYMTRTIPAMQKDQRTMAASYKEEREALVLMQKEERNKFLERMDCWAEGVRQDSKSLNETLHKMTEHCKEVAVKFGGQGGTQ